MNSVQTGVGLSTLWPHPGPWPDREAGELRILVGGRDARRTDTVLSWSCAARRKATAHAGGRRAAAARSNPGATPGMEASAALVNAAGNEHRQHRLASNEFAQLDGTTGAGAGAVAADRNSCSFVAASVRKMLLGRRGSARPDTHAHLTRPLAPAALSAWRGQRTSARNQGHVVASARPAGRWRRCPAGHRPKPNSAAVRRSFGPMQATSARAAFAGRCRPGFAPSSWR